MLPESYVTEGLAQADDWRVFGVPVRELSKDELLACLVQSMRSARDASERHMRSVRLMREMNSRRKTIRLWGF